MEDRRHDCRTPHQRSEMAPGGEKSSRLLVVEVMSPLQCRCQSMTGKLERLDLFKEVLFARMIPIF